MIIVALVLIGALLRVVGLGKDLWLDEVWALRAATELSSAWSVFTMHHEINHYLNTLWLYALGPSASSTLYHLPSYLLGLSAVGIAGAIGLRRGAACGIATAAVFALSYEMILYSTEARGYAGVVFSTLLGFYALERALDDGGTGWLALYWLACWMGVLCHPIYAAFLAAAIVWTGRRAYTVGSGASAVGRELIRLHALPVLALGVLWFIDLRLVVAGGGTPANSFVGVYGSALAWAIAAGRAQGVELVCCVLVVGMLASAIHAERRMATGYALFFVSAVVIFPIALVLLRGSDLVYTRHFLIAGLFALLLFGLTMGRWWTEGRRRAVLVAGAVFLIVNVFNIVTLARDGRGQYRDAIEYMAASTAGDTVTIAGDHDFRIGMEMSYYLPRAQTIKRLVYVEQGNWPAAGPDWIVTHRESWITQEPEPRIDVAAGLQYSFVKAFPTAPLSGLNWYLYHRAAAR